jgi:hypothetical protein
MDTLRTCPLENHAVFDHFAGRFRKSPVLPDAIKLRTGAEKTSPIRNIDACGSVEMAKKTRDKTGVTGQ